MSRSYRKTPVCKDKNSKFGKRQANQAVRKNMDIPNGGSFKKAYCSWNICDYRMFESEKQLKHDWDNNNYNIQSLYKNYKQALIAWKKAHVFK